MNSSLRQQSEAGNPIRRPPNTNKKKNDDDLISVDASYYSTTRPSPTSKSSNSELARLFLGLACLWPLIFLFIPPPRGGGSGSGSGSSANLSLGGVQHSSYRDRVDALRRRISSNVAADREFLKEEMSSLLGRTESVGYGPSQPRFAAIVVVPPPSSSSTKRSNTADEEELEDQRILLGATRAVESIFEMSDRNRIFVVVVVMDGRVGGTNHQFERWLRDVDSGKTAHRHGDQIHTHDETTTNNGEDDGDEKEEEEHVHSQKVHAIYNRQAMGVSASRDEAVRFINVLVQKHEEAGLKSTEEELLLLLLRCDSSLREMEGIERTWLDDVTDALIPTYPSSLDVVDNNETPPIREDGRPSPLPANAVSFVVDHSTIDTKGQVHIRPSNLGVTYSFDKSLQVVRSHASGQDMSLSDGVSYPTPLVTAATALRLNTYNSLPAADAMLTTSHAADVQLSLNLWMCADGIDVIGDGPARVVVDPAVLSVNERGEVSGPLAARIVGAWIAGHVDEIYADGILHAVASSAASSWQDHQHSQNDRALSVKTRELKNALVRIASEARQTATFPVGLERKCRPFSWYVRHVNPLLEMNVNGETDPHTSLMRLPTDDGKGVKKLPSKSLDDVRMAIVQRASPVALKYVDASGNHVAHPHLGATDENGVFGYVHDETSLRANPPQFEFKNDDDRNRLCKKGDPNYIMLTDKVFVDIQNHEAAERRVEHDLATKSRVKIFCLVYTIEKSHGKIPAIRETWGNKCDGFMVGSTKTDKALGTVNIPHEGPEEYDNIWQKVRAMWSYIYDNYYEKYDYFHIGGDDLFLIVENLRLYLESEEIVLASNGGRFMPDGTEDSQTPLFLGRRFAEGGDRNRMFISGGSGYTMNRAALKTLVVDAFPQCFPHMHTFSEDVMVATCLRKMDVLPYDTKDEAGGERYMPFEPGHHLTYMPPKNPKDDWYSNYSVDVKWGIDHCAAKSVAFHYINSDLMRRMHAILYHQCGHGAKLPPTIDKPVTKVNEEQKLAPLTVVEKVQDTVKTMKLTEQKAEQKVQDDQVAAIAVIEKAQDNVKAVKSIEQQEAEQKLRDDKVAAKAAPVKHDKDLVTKKESENTRDDKVAAKAAPVKHDKDLVAKKESEDTAKMPHLYPYFPPMPPHIMAEDLFGKEIITDTLAHNKPTIAGIIAILQRFLRNLHQFLVNNRDSSAKDVVEKYFALVDKDLAPLDTAYRDKPIFPIREDGSIFMSLGAYRDHLLGETLRQAFHYAANPDKLYVGAVVQNCFGIDVQCRTGVEVKGTDIHGNPITAISDRPPDPNGIEEFCGDPDYKKYCDSGQIRVLYVNETESNGPTTARYFASKLWGGETYYMQSDAHLRFAQDWDRYFHEEVLTAKLYPKAILSSYPPGFSDGDPPYKGGSIGERLCTCEFSSSDVEDHIIRINTGNHCKGEEAAPTQIAYIAAGFFFTRAEFLTEIPFDPYLPWCFMGEEIALSLRAWTHGWGIYAPRKNVFAHQYRPGRMGLPKFWENTGRVFGRPGPGFNTELQKITLQRIKHMVGYKESDKESLQQHDIQVILTDYEHYGPGDVRTTQAFLDHNKIDVQTQKCGWNEYCNECTLP